MGTIYMVHEGNHRLHYYNSVLDNYTLNILYHFLANINSAYSFHFKIVVTRTTNLVHFELKFSS
jgi:hypothetical protein